MSDSDSSSDDDHDEPAEELSTESMALFSAVTTNPRDHGAHLNLINALRSEGHLRTLRSARERFHENFPLPEIRWMEWISDELKEKEEPGFDFSRIDDLYERALSDCGSINMWIEYLTFTTSRSDKSTTQSRAVCESSLTAMGVHVAEGARLWRFLTTLEVQQLSTLTNPMEVAEQKERVRLVFKRQLATPLVGNSEAMESFRACDCGADEAMVKVVEELYAKSEAALQDREKNESDLKDTCGQNESTWRMYAKYEIKAGDPARAICVFERSLLALPQSHKLWLEYSRLISHTLHNHLAAKDVLRRAVRSAGGEALWTEYMRAVERAGGTVDEVREIGEQALAGAFASADDYVKVMLAVCDAAQRQVRAAPAPAPAAAAVGGSADDVPTGPPSAAASAAGAAGVAGSKAERVTKLREQYTWAMTFVESWYAEWEHGWWQVARYAAVCELETVGDVEAAKALWERILRKCGRSVGVWRDVISQTRGWYLREPQWAVEKCRTFYRRAVHSITDAPEQILDEWLQFERELGTLASLHEADVKVYDRYTVYYA
jgi:hypothetical protein